jgi:hypothetical protein
VIATPPVRWPRAVTRATTLVTTIANPQQVGRPASANKAIAVFKLTIELKLSFNQLVHLTVLLFILFFS